MTPTPEDDAAVALAILQEATERLIAFMAPNMAARAIAEFGIMSVIFNAGYSEAREVIMVATAKALDTQLRAGEL